MKPWVDGSFRILKKISKNTYKLELPAGYDISPTFNVKDLRPHIGDEGNVDLRTSLCFQSWGINTGVFSRQK